MNRILSNAIVVLMAAVAVISCKDEKITDPTVAIDAETITLTQKETYQLTATLSDYSHDYVVWASNNSEVASVSQEGLVTAVAPGDAVITAKTEFGKNRVDCAVHVNPIYVTSIKLDKESITKKEGETETLKVTLTPSDATYQTVTWTTSDEEVATVKDGVVSCIGAGTATITATTASGATSGAALTATCTVNVKSSGNFIKWFDDKAGSKNFITDPVSDPATSEKGCISYDGSRISWTANETGAPRIDSLTLSNGSKIVITQFEEADIAGAYTFTTKVFAGAGAVTPAADPKTMNVTFSIVNAPVSLQDYAGATHINDIEISGLFDTMVLTAAFEFSYDAKTAKLGLFLDTRDGAGQPVGTKYGTFFPGLCTQTASAWAKPWLYTETELGDPDYTWLWFDYDVENGEFMLVNRTNASVPMQELAQYSSTTMNKMCGFGVVLSDSNVFNHTTVTSYANFFQMNPAGFTGEFFKKVE